MTTYGLRALATNRLSRKNFSTRSKSNSKKRTGAHITQNLLNTHSDELCIVRCVAEHTRHTRRKGILYYRARCVMNCTNPLQNFNFGFIAGKIGELIEKLSFTDDELVEIDAKASTDIAILDVKRISQLEIASARKKKIREDLAYLNANRLMLLKTAHTLRKNSSRTKRVKS